LAIRNSLVEVASIILNGDDIMYIGAAK